MKTRITWLSGLLGLAMALSGLPAQASTAWSWALGGTPSSGLSGSVSAYKATDNSTPLSSATAVWYGSSYGYGVCESDPCPGVPQHAMDNEGQRESLLLSFGGDVSLSSFAVGWAYEDYAGSEVGSSGGGTAGADVSLLAYTGSGTPITTGAGGTTYGGMLSSGWTLIGNYGNVTGTRSVATAVSSSYWLIAAYNSVFAGGCSTCSDAGSSNDFVKITSVAGTAPDQQVPEPGSLLLVAAPMIALALRRRRET